MQKSKSRNLLTLFILIVIVFAISFGSNYSKWRAYSEPNTQIYFFDVGQGDASLIKTSKNKLILIDGGPSDSITYQLAKTLPFWVRKIDLVIISHSHDDHIFGILKILERYRIECLVYRMDDKPNSETEIVLREYIKSNNIELVDYDQGEGIDNCINSRGEIRNFALDRSEITEAYKSPKKSENQNLESIVTLFTQGDFEVLFTGDAEIPVQKAILPLISKDIEVVKVPHHGGLDSYEPAILESLKPEVAVFSVGKGNVYRHPHQKTLDGYYEHGISTHRTDLDGTIKVVYDGDTYVVIK